MCYIYAAICSIPLLGSRGEPLPINLAITLSLAHALKHCSCRAPAHAPPTCTCIAPAHTPAHENGSSFYNFFSGRREPPLLVWSVSIDQSASWLVHQFILVHLYHYVNTRLGHLHWKTGLRQVQKKSEFNLFSCFCCFCYFCFFCCFWASDVFLMRFQPLRWKRCWIFSKISSKQDQSQLCSSIRSKVMSITR